MLSTSLTLLLSLAAQDGASPHAAELYAHRHELHLQKPRLPFVFGGAPLSTPRVSKVVYGYYPYWVSAWDQLRWDLLTHIAYFAVEMHADGTLGGTHGWPDPGFVETAHMFGVRVDLVFTLFSGSGVRTLCSDATNRARGVDNMIDQLELGGADGINIDFESLSSGTRDCLTDYVSELRQTLTARGHADAQISMAGAAVDYGANFDLGALASLIDVYFVMGYGYHWGGSAKPGPNGQLRVTESWRPHISISMQRSIAYYAGLVPEEQRARIVWGVPYYGQEWPTSSDAMHAATTGDAVSRTYAVTRRAVAGTRTRRWDEDSQNPWYTFEQGGWHQCWYDDEESLAAKYELVLEQNIGGVGMWALGYDESYPELWSLLESYFVAPQPAREGTRELPRVIGAFPFAEDNDTHLSPSNFFNAYSCARGTPEYGREWVYQFTLCEPGTITAEVTDGAGVDVDLQLLSAPREDACLARDDAHIERALEPGTYFLTADAFVSDQVPQDGAYHLSMDFVPAPDSPGCEPPLEPTPSMPLRPTPPTGQIIPAQPGPGPGPEPNTPPETPEDPGCACTTQRARSERTAPVLFAVLGGLALARRRSRSAQ